MISVVCLVGFLLLWHSRSYPHSSILSHRVIYSGTLGIEGDLEGI